jgi:hypothetical protein
MGVDDKEAFVLTQSGTGQWAGADCSGFGAAASGV